MTMQKRKILLHDRTGVPFTIQLARELANQGHDVLYSYGAFFQSPKGSLEPRPQDPPNLEIVAMYLDKPFHKYSFIKRYFQEIKYANDLVDQIRKFDPDVTILTGSHPDALSIVYKKCKDLHTKMVFWVQDIYGLAIKRILGRKIPLIGSLIGEYYIYQEKKLLYQSDEVIIITEDFLDLMELWKVSREKIHVVYNWAPVEEFPVKPKSNRWAKQNHLKDKTCILYSGTLGLKHNPDLLLQLAIHFKMDDEVRVIVISEGLGADWLKEKKDEFSLNNLILMDFQPFEDMPNILASADILVAILEPGAGIYSAPSKVLTYLCAQRPLLVAIPPDNLSARIVTSNQAGIVVPPEDVQGFVKAAVQLVDDSDTRQIYGENARVYAENNFNITKISQQFKQFI